MRIVGDALGQAGAAGDVDILENAQHDLLEQRVLRDVALGHAVIKEVGDAPQEGAALLRGRLARQFQKFLAQHVAPTPVRAPAEFVGYDCKV